MATTISKLSILLTANAQGLNSTLTNAGKRMERFNDQLTRGLRNIPGLSKLTQFGSGLGAGLGAGAAAAGAMAAAFGTAVVAGRQLLAVVNSSREELDKLAKSAATFGIDPNALNSIRLAASEMAGMSEQTVDIAMQRFAKRIGMAAEGSKELQALFQRLGLDAGVLVKLPLDVAFKRVADAVKDLDGDAFRQLSIGAKLFDSEGARLVNVLREGSDILDEYAVKSALLGGFFDKEMLKNVEAMNDAVSRLVKMFSNMGKQLTLSIAGPLNDIIKELETNEDFWHAIAGAARITAEMIIQAAKWVGWMSKQLPAVRNAVVSEANRWSIIPIFGQGGKSPGASFMEEAARQAGLESQMRELQAQAVERAERQRLNALPAASGITGSLGMLGGVFGAGEVVAEQMKALQKQQVDEAKRQNDLMLQLLGEQRKDPLMLGVIP